MLTVNCPNCGAEVRFRSPALPVVVCGYCQSMVTRIGDDMRVVGRSAVLPFDVSPIRIGTIGRHDGQGFEVIGRVRWGWSDGSWNEWLLLFHDGTSGWLGEAMGQYMLLREVPDEEASKNPLVRQIAAGGAARINMPARLGGDLKVADIRDVTCLAAEGELPFTAPAGWTIHSIDLRGTDGACASIQRDCDETHVYVGRYVALADLAPRGLRGIEGWPLPAFAA